MSKISDLVLEPSRDVDPAQWDEGKYDAFVDALCHQREYQKTAIFAALRFLLGGRHNNLRELARDNFDSKPKMQEAYGSWDALKSRLQLPDKLSCTLDLATGTGKSYVLYGLAAIMLAEGIVDRVLLLCPSRTIESGLIDKFRSLAADEDLRSAMPDDAQLTAPRIIRADQTISEGDICVENYHAILQHVGTSIRSNLQGKGEKTLVLNDEAHHVAASPGDTRRWKEFLLDGDFNFRYIVGVSGTCYIGNEYFTDVVSQYSLRDAIEERVVKDIEYVRDAPRLADPDNKWQLIHQNQERNKRALKKQDIRPITIVVTKNINGCESIADDLRRFLCGAEKITSEQAKSKVLVVTSKSPIRDIARLKSVDNPQSKVEWIVSVSMLTEGWDVKNVFQIVPHEERAFNSKLLISQVLGRGLRVPESWQGAQPVVTVFNHMAWTDRIENLVDEILDIQQRVSSLIIPNSDYHFDLHNLNYDRLTNEKKYKMTGEYNLFKDGFIHLPTADATEPVAVEYERVRGHARKIETTIRHKTFSAAEIAAYMHKALEAIDAETRGESEPKKRTNYARKYTKQLLQEVVLESVRRAKITENEIPAEIKQRCLSALNVLKRKISKTVTYEAKANQLEPICTRERQAVSCSAAELHNKTKTVFYRSDAAEYLPPEQRDFFEKLTDEDGEFAGQAEKVANTFLFKSPVNLAIADHTPERKFIRKLIEPANAEKISGWIKNSDMGFYSVEYAWGKESTRRSAHTKRGAFSPDFFIKTTAGAVLVVEIKDDGEVDNPSRENIAKREFSVNHFELLNDWLKKDGVACRYQFNMLTPRDYEIFFKRLQEEDTDGYRSHLDAKMSELTTKNGTNGR